MSDFKPMTECKGFNMERVLLKNKNGYMITAYFKDDMLQCDGDEDWTHPIAWDSFIRLGDLANGVEQSSSNCNIPIVSGSVLTDVDYWKIRCKLSEAIEAASPCDPDITTKQINAYSDYNKFIERYGTDR